MKNTAGGRFAQSGSPSREAGHPVGGFNEDVTFRGLFAGPRYSAPKVIWQTEHIHPLARSVRQNILG
ncbi:MAG: hypothetical protein ACM32J_04660, partial [Rhizobacter sp.]